MVENTANNNKNILVYGLGRSGRGVLRYLAALRATGQAITIFWHDQQPKSEDLALVAEVGAQAVTASSQIGLVVAAPGVAFDHPDLLGYRAAGIATIGEMELAQDSLHWLGTPPMIVGITGTAGKGSTSALIEHLLKALGLTAMLGGNFDPSFLAVALALAPLAAPKIAVVELSSFQLERCFSFRPAIAVITNLASDHLDRHGSIEAYHQAKWNITRAQTSADTLIVMPDLALAATKAQIKTTKADNLAAFAGLLAQLPGHLHPDNARLALLALEAVLLRLGLALTDERLAQLKAAITSFAGVPGRFELVATINGTQFIEDSIATRTLSVKAALERAPAPIRWIVGGRDKGAELAPLAELVAQKVALIIAIGEAGAHFAAAFATTPSVSVALPDGEAALAEAVRLGLHHAAAGSVLLAPLGTSFDQFKDYKARGAAFAAAVHALAAEIKTTTEITTETTAEITTQDTIG
jgi:UDP-N-acetylmuramoylalanine--D-glutamate ligase